MRRVLTFAAVAALGLSSAASANQWVIDIGSFGIGNSGTIYPPFVTYHVTVGPGADIIGLHFAGVLSELGGGALPQDLLLTITAPTGTTYQVGGYDTYTGNPWTFSNSWGPKEQNFADLFGAGEPTGNWSFTFSYDWVGPSIDAFQTWEDVVVTLHAIPAPGAVALLGVAALVGTRRRRGRRRG